VSRDGLAPERGASWYAPAGMRITSCRALAVALVLAACARESPPSSPALPAPPPSPPAAAPTAAAAPEPRPPEPAPPARTCADDGWPAYAHDAARSSASLGCLDGPLVATWRFEPAAHLGRTGHALHAVVARGSVYVSSAYGKRPYEAPALHALDDATGAPVWISDSRADILHAHWPLAARGSVALDDDGLYLADAATGKTRIRGLDTWGMLLDDGERLYLTNTWQEDGPGLFVAALDDDGRPVWKANRRHAHRIAIPDLGGICLSGARLVHAASYLPAKLSSLDAYDPGSGARLWSVAVVPGSAPSASGDRVFLVETEKGGADVLAARSTKDGSRIWATPVAGARGPAPVVARGLVVIHAADGVEARDAATGDLEWRAPIVRTMSEVRHATSLAAALGSASLVVTAGGLVHVLSLEDGSERWVGSPQPGVVDVHSPVLAGGSLYVVAEGGVTKMAPAR
jgi:outer membrane protein assembly factor BamB